MRTTLIAAVAISAWSVTACGGDTSGQRTPQETAARYKAAMIEQDWETALTYFTRKAQADLVGAAYLAAAYATQGDTALAREFVEFAEQRGLTKTEGFQDAENLPALFREITDWTEEHVSESKGAFVEIAEDMGATEFSEFEIDGDRAAAQMATPERTRRVRFRKIDGRWYLES